MFSEVQKEWKNSTVGIFAAAVADYRPEVEADQKIKKKDDSLILTLVKNPDILSWAGANKTEKQVLVGFALETTNAIENGKEKLSRKNLDLIVVNTLEDEGAGFGHDTNKISIIDNHNKITRFELMTKSQTAIEIVDYLKKYI